MRRVFGLLTLLVAVLTGTVSSVAQNGLSSAKYTDANTSRFWGAARSVPSTMAPAANATIDNGTKATSAFQPPSAGVPGAGVALTSIPGFALGRTIQTAPIPTGITTGDFNRDGKTDWVVASGEGTLWLYLGNGDGTAQRPRAIWPGGKLLSSQISGGQPAFEPVPVALASGDLRNNGISDLIIAEGNDNNTVAVLLGNGDGNFQPAVRYQMNFVGTYIRVADLNNDGHPDLVIGGLNGGITVFLGDGSGKFSSAPFAFGLPSGPPAPSPDNYIAGLPTIFAIGDFDHDGIQDIAYSGEGGAWVLRGIGNGQFNAAQQLLSQRTCAHTCLYYSTSAAFIDADGDGFLDLVATDNVGRAYVFRNKGDGTFDPQGVSFTTGLVAGDISVADINHDGHPDLIMGSSFYLFNPLESPLAGQVATNSLAVAYGDGRGGFPSVHLFRGGTGMVSLATADLNQDGFSEVLTADQISETYSIFMNNGIGGFGPPDGGVLLVPTDSAGALSSLNSPGSGFTLADVNGDGKPDAVAVGLGLTPTIGTALNLGNGQFAPSTRSVPPDSSISHNLTTGDFRNIGQKGVVFSSLDGATSREKVFYVPNTGAGQFGTATQIGSWRALMLATSDLNRDGKLDLITAAENTIGVALGNGNGSFGSLGVYTFADPTGGVPRSLTVQDVNGDGKPDILLLTRSPIVQSDMAVLFLGNGDGTFQPARQLATSLGPSSVADLNGDGHLDMVAVTYTAGTPQITVYAGQSDGSLTAASTYVLPAGVSVLNVLLGDFDGDGNIDAAIEQRTADNLGFIQILRGNGDLTLTPIFHIYPTYSSSYSMLVADVDGDGKSDLVEWDDYSNSFHVLAGTASPPGLDVCLVTTAPIANTARIAVQLDVASPSEVVGMSVIPNDVSVPVNLSFTAGASYQEFDAGISPTHAPSDVFQIIGQLGTQSASFYGAKAFNPIPRLAVLTVQSSVAGDPGFSLALYGIDFVPGATVLFDGTPRPTTYVSSMQVSFDLTNADLSVGGPHQISVLNPGPGGGESGSNNFFVEYNQVGISGLTPSFAPVGSAGFTLNINGGIFDTGSVVRWDGIDRATKFIDRNNLTITLSAADLAVTGSHSVIVFDPRNGALISDSATFAVVANTPPTGQVESFGNGFNGSHTIGTSAILSVRGWVGDYGDNTSMVAFLRVNGSDQNLASTSVDLPRPDIALQYNRPDWVNSGFQFATNLGNRPGTYTIQIIGKDRFGATSGLPIQGGSNVVTIVDEPKPTGLLDSVAGPDGSFTVPQDSNVYVSGWAAIQGSWESPAGVRIFLNDILHPVGDAQIGIARPDLVTLTGNPGLLNRGFAFQFNIGSAPLGLHYIIPEAFNPVGDSALLGFSDGTGAVLVNVVSPDTTIAKPNIVPLVSSLSFETEQVGSVSTAQSVTITNAGGGPLNVLGVSISGDFSQTNNCRVIVAGSSCSMSVTFHPSEVGNRTGEVTIYSNASTSPSSIVLSGAGAGVGVLSISSVSVSFGPQLIGTSSPTQSVTLSNTGNAVLIIHGISVSSAFSQQNTCGTPLAAGSNCTVSIGFNPNSGGAIAGTLQIGTNAAPSVVTVPISGIGQDFMLTPGPSSTTSATVVAGQTATYLLTLSPIGGMSGTVNFGCSGTPPHASCSISPTAASLGTVTNITVAVTTGGSSAGALTKSPEFPPFSKSVYLWLFWLAFLGATTSAVRRARPALISTLYGLSLFMFIVLIGCGGSGNAPSSGGTTPPSSTATPTGNYSLTVTASTPSLSHTVTLAITVK